MSIHFHLPSATPEALSLLWDEKANSEDVTMPSLLFWQEEQKMAQRHLAVVQSYGMTPEALGAELDASIQAIHKGRLLLCLVSTKPKFPIEVECQFCPAKVKSTVVYSLKHPSYEPIYLLAETIHNIQFHAYFGNLDPERVCQVLGFAKKG